jgi:hypothetical protein
MPGDDACVLAFIRKGMDKQSLTLNYAQYRGMDLGKDYIIGEGVWEQFGGSAQYAASNPQGVFRLLGLDFTGTARYAGLTAIAVQQGEYLSAIENGGVTAGYAVAEFYESDLTTTGNEPKLEITADLVRSAGSIGHWLISWPIWILGFILDVLWEFIKALVFLAAGLLMIAVFVQVITVVGTVFGLINK